MLETRSVLIIDRDPAFRTNAGRYLAERGYTVADADSAQLGLTELRRVRPDFVMLDLGLQQSAGVDLIDALVSAPERPGVVCVASGARVSDVVAAVRAGALDVLERPVDGERLVRILARASRPEAAVAPAVSGAAPLYLTQDPVIDTLVAESASMKALLAKAERLAPAEEMLVLEGEIGSSQDGIARHFQSAGPRAGGPFVKVAAVPERGTAEEVLFGTTTTPSAFAQAKGGVVFIESVAALGDAGQDRLAKLLVGLTQARQSGQSVRWPPMVVCVERPMAVEVESGVVRRDLAAALGQTRLVVQAIRDRREDIPELVHRVVSAMRAEVGVAEARVDASVMKTLVERDWEGNIPELVSTVRQAACKDSSGQLVLDLTVRPAQVPAMELAPEPKVVATPVSSPRAEEAPAWMPTLDENGQVQPYDVYEAQIFRFALKNAGGCVSRAAELLGVGRATMYRKMRAYEIDVPPVAERSIARSRRARKRRAAERAIAQGAANGTQDLAS